MRTPTTRELAVQTSAHKRIPARVWIANAAGTYVDFTTLAGVNWLDSATYTFDSEQPVANARVALRRDYELLSLAPLVVGSALNQGSVAVDVKRKIKIETATVPEDANYAVQSGDWRNVFEGYIDEIDPASDSKSSPLILQCRDLGGKLQDRWLKKTGRPSGSAYGTLSGGRAMETVAQDLLDDVMGVGAITLYTPNGSDATPVNAGDLSGWMIKQWLPDKQSLLDALRILANQIGYEIRYRWSTLSTPAKWRLEIFNPPRSKVTPDGTILVSQYFNIRKASISVVGVRNDIDVSYQTDPNDPTTRTTVNATDATSVARYDDCWMGVTEGASSAINTPTEANKMAAAILSDLKDPKLNHSAEGEYLYQYELYDLVAYKANGRDYDSDQNIGVASITHELSAGHARTTIYGSGVVRGAYDNWQAIAGTAGVAPSVKTWPGPTLGAPTAAPIIGGISVAAPVTTLMEPLTHYEVHVSTTTGFTPSPSTRVATTKGSAIAVTGLPVGVTHFVKLVPIFTSGVAGPATAQVSVVAGQTAAAIALPAALNVQQIGAVFDCTTTNNIPNPSFEVNVTDGWTSVGGITVARDTSQKWNGVASAAMSITNVAASQGIVTTPNNLIAAVAADVWQFSAYLRASATGKSALFKAEALDSGGTVLSTRISAVALPLSSTAWWRYNLMANFVGVASVAFVRFSILNDGTANGAWTLYADGVQAERTQVATAPLMSSYCDGSLGPGYSWAGTAHNSASSRVAGKLIIAPPGSGVFPGAPIVEYTDGTLKAKRLLIGGDWNSGQGNDNEANLLEVIGTTISSNGYAPLDPQITSLNGRVQLGGLSSGNGLNVIGAGNAFPSTRQTSDVFFRTDRGILYYYDGTNWLSVQVKTFTAGVNGALPGTALAATTASTFISPIPDPQGGTQVQVLGMSLAWFVNGGGTALAHATQDWNIGISGTGGANFGSMDVTDFSTVSAAWKNGFSNLGGPFIRTVSTDIRWLVNVTKIGTPGSLLLPCPLIHYRLVG